MTGLSAMAVHEELRTCNRCGLVKPISQFTKNKACSNGVRGHCKRCDADYQLKWTSLNGASVQQTKQRSRQKHSFRNLIYAQLEFLAFPELVRDRRKRTYQKYRDVYLMYGQLRSKAFRDDFRDAQSASSLAWYHRNRIRLAPAISERNKRNVIRLSDGYVRNRIRIRGSVPSLEGRDIPPGLIAAKRAHIQVKRLLKESRK